MSDDQIYSAHAKIDGHEKICAERYGHIDEKLTSLRSMIEAQGTVFHERLNTISNRMWGAACGTLGLVVIGLAGLAMYLLVRGK